MHRAKAHHAKKPQPRDHIEYEPTPARNKKGARIKTTTRKMRHRLIVECSSDPNESSRLARPAPVVRDSNAAVPRASEHGRDERPDSSSRKPCPKRRSRRPPAYRSPSS